MAYADDLYKKNFLEYASYVIRERAIPEIEDGFKPVQRRIMHTLFTLDDGKFIKVAGVVGEAMKYHPHGDSSIYDALVNLVAYLGNPRAISNGSRGQTAFFINEVIVVFLEDVFCRHIRATELGKFVAGLRLEHLEYQGREVLVSEECVSYTSVCLDRLHTLGEYPVAEFLIDKRVYVSDDALAGLLSIEIKSERTIDKAIAPLIYQLLGG